MSNHMISAEDSYSEQEKIKTIVKQEPIDEREEVVSKVKRENQDEEAEVKSEPSLDDLIGKEDANGTRKGAKTTPKRKRMSDLIKTPTSDSKIKKEANVKKEASVNKQSNVKEESNEMSVKQESHGSRVKKEPAKRKPKVKIVKTEEVLDTVDDLVEEFNAEAKPIKKPKAESTPRKKKNPYGLSPGQSPFPDFKMPTPEAAREVSRLLSQAHGAVHPPKELQPSLDVSGCGEVPSVLDALIRTLLSAATTNKNSSNAFQGLVKRFGTYKSGVGKGSVNWNNVREAPVEDIEEAIRTGGLAKAKSKNIKKILDIVYETNQARRKALLEEQKSGQTASIVGADSETQKQKKQEIEVADSHVLSLQYVHELSTEDAMIELLKMPGVGVKVSSCVLLFCLRRPSFAVDTHVWRLCKWLKWVPPKATRDQTFSHCEVRVPDDLKYGLHKLLIRHGRTCPRCRAAVSSKNEAYANAKCPIEHLVTRTGTRKET